MLTISVADPVGGALLASIAVLDPTSTDSERVLVHLSSGSMGGPWRWINYKIGLELMGAFRAPGK